MTTTARTMMDLWYTLGPTSRERYGPWEADYDPVTEWARGLRLKLKKDPSYARDVVATMRATVERAEAAERALEKQRVEYESRIEALNADARQLDEMLRGERRGSDG